MIFDIYREAYSTLEITHLTLVYNIVQLQHVYKRRFVDLLQYSFNIMRVCFISELNLRFWQESKKMFEQNGQRPVVYNNKCGQICSVSRDNQSKI